MDDDGNKDNKIWKGGGKTKTETETDRVQLPNYSRYIRIPNRRRRQRQRSFLGTHSMRYFILFWMHRYIFIYLEEIHIFASYHRKTLPQVESSTGKVQQNRRRADYQMLPIKEESLVLNTFARILRHTFDLEGKWSCTFSVLI
jgi:hypothetical protein